MNNLIANLFNIDLKDVEKFNTVNDNDGFVCHIRMKKPLENLYCLKCNKKMVGNGTENKKITHKILIEKNIKVIYEARRFRCKCCNYSISRTTSA